MTFKNLSETGYWPLPNRCAQERRPEKRGDLRWYWHRLWLRKVTVWQFQGTPAAGLCQQGLECKQNTSSLFPPGSDTWGRPWARAHLEDDCFRRLLLLWSMTSSVGCLGGSWRDVLQSLNVSKCSLGHRPEAGQSWSAGAKPPKPLFWVWFNQTPGGSGVLK